MLFVNNLRGANFSTSDKNAMRENARCPNDDVSHGHANLQINYTLFTYRSIENNSDRLLADGLGTKISYHCHGYQSTGSRKGRFKYTLAVQNPT